MRGTVLGWMVGSVLVLCAVEAQAAPSVKDTMQYRPAQKDVEYETPELSEYAQCRVEVEQGKKTSGWVVFGPAGQPLRRFVDTNGDNVVDQWRYYNRGLEVYRDIDSNFNNKVDQSRWLNTGGSRWGLDSDENGTIDSWKLLTAEEATRVAVNALVSGDSHLFGTLLINAEDVRQLALAKPTGEKLLANVADAGKQAAQVVSSSKTMNRTTKWLRFDSSVPSTIPADSGTASSDLMLYENAMAIIETSGKPGLVQFGEIVRVGDVWKLTQAPKPLEGNTIQITDGGTLMRPAAIAGATPGTPATITGISEKTQKLIAELQQLDRNSTSATSTPAALSKYTSKRTDILTQLVSSSSTDDEREQWTRQIVDGLASAVQAGADEASFKQLAAIEADVRKKSPAGKLAGYVAYRRMLAGYTIAVREPDASKRQKAQEQWLKDLEAFVKKHPKADDAPEAMLQLAISLEFGGKVKDARKWYDRLAADHATTPAGVRAKGAVRRQEMTGKPFEFSGHSLKGKTIDLAGYRGKVVLVDFWATWCKPCTEDLPQLRELYKQYHGSGFEIVGVNIDIEAAPVQPYLTEHKVTWPQIHSAGGLESEAARTFGIISLPTMFLIDSDGKVLDDSASIESLKTALAKKFKTK